MTFPEMIHGKKPEVAPFIPTDPLEELRKLLEGEIKDYPSISKLGELFQEDIFSKLSAAGLDLRSLIGLGGENVEQAQKNALALQKGQLPPEDIAAIQRNSAFQSLGSGLMGSQMAGANSLRNLGIGVLQGQEKGAALASEAGNAAQRWQQIAMGTVLPPSSQLYSPDWFTQFMAQQRAAKQATKQFKYNVAAAPDPVVSGIAGTVMNLVGAYLGAGRGGGGNMLQTSDPNGIQNAALVNAGQPASYTNQYGTSTVGPLEDISYNAAPAQSYQSYQPYQTPSVSGVPGTPQTYQQYQPYFNQVNQGG